VLRPLRPILWPELIGRLIQDRERSAPELFPLPLLEPAPSDFVGQGGPRQQQVGKPELAPEGCASTSFPPVERRKASCTVGDFQETRAKGRARHGTIR